MSIACPGSAHMRRLLRRLWIAAAERFEIRGWRASGSVVWPVMGKSASESVAIGLEPIDAARQVRNPQLR
jgi:hypothetical protein